MNTPMPLRTAINRRIRWGATTASGQKRAIIFSCFALVISCGWMFMKIAIRDCYIKHALPMQRLNISSLERSTRCFIDNMECRCPIWSNGTLFSDPCLPSLQWLGMLLTPVLSSVLQLFVLREYVTLEIAGNRFFRQSTWAVFPLVSIGIAIPMFSASCYHDWAGAAIALTSTLLAILVFRDCTENTMTAENEHRHTNTHQSGQEREFADNDPIPWNEIL